MRAAGYPHPTSVAVTAAMKGNRRADTKPEIALRSALHAQGLRFRKDFHVAAGSVRVKVDVAFPRLRVAVFIDGCFWHGCPEHGRMPRANEHYWGPKLERNRMRDVRVTDALEAHGWAVLRLWEHESIDDAVRQVAAVLAVR